VHAHFAGEAGEWAHLIARSIDAPYSVTVHAVDLFKPRPSLGEVLRGASPTVTISRFNQAWIRRNHAVEAHVVPCGIRVGDYTAADAGGEGPLRVVSIGRPVAKKGLDTLIAAVREARGVELHLIGSTPPDHPRVRGGLLRAEEVPAALAAAHVFCLPCRVAPDGDRDGIPVAMMEAMASALPIITTQVSGIPELVDESVGWFVAPDDVAALTAVLEHVARSPDARARRGSAGRQRIARRSVGAQVDRLLAAWRS
jgi:glycosyltransferase involved in cell wall biosynthesis